MIDAKKLITGNPNMSGLFVANYLKFSEKNFFWIYL